MTSTRSLALSIFVLGLAATAAFHAGGALSEYDAIRAATIRGGVELSPPGPLTSRALGLGTDLVRVAWAPTLLFRSVHLVNGILLAIAAALSALFAMRAADGEAARIASGLIVGGTVLFGADLIGSAATSGPVPLLLVLLSASALAWSSDEPSPWWGGIFLGAAVAEHPLALFVLPGYGALAMGATLKVSPDESAGVQARAAGGFLLGLLVLVLPRWDAGGTLDVGAAVSAWASAPGGSFWSFVGPSGWVDGFVGYFACLWRNTGPIVLVAAVLGKFAFFGGYGRTARPFLLIHPLLGVVMILGRAADPGTLAALAAWSLVMWCVPALSALAARTESSPGKIPVRVPALAALGVVAMLLLPSSRIDRSSERTDEWARASLMSMPENALLLTSNPVQWALAKDGEADPDDIVYAPRPNPAALRRIVAASAADRTLLLDPGLHFDGKFRAELLGADWRTRPLDATFQIVPRDSAPAGPKPVFIWRDLDLTVTSPPSELRGGLTAGEYYARTILQTAFDHLEGSDLSEAEKWFLMALTLDEGDRSLAAFGFGQVLFRNRQFGEVRRLVQTYVDESEKNAWLALRLAGTAAMQEENFSEAIPDLERALRLMPDNAERDRLQLQNLLNTARARLP